MGRTRTNIRQEVARQTGLPFINGTTTATAATTLTHAAQLGRFATDELVGLYVYYPDETSAQNRVITDSTTAGVATVRPSNAPSAQAEAYEILAFPADAIHDAINSAALMLYDRGILSREHWIMAVAGSPIYNADMAYWTSSTALDGWTVTTATNTRSQGAANKWVGVNASLLTAAAGTLVLASPWRRYLADLAPGSVRLHAWVRAQVASDLRIQLLEDGTAVSSSGYHSGDNDFHVISTDWYKPADSETDFNVQYDYAGAGQGTLSFIWFEGGNYPHLHPIPYALFPDGPSYIRSAPLGLDTANTRTTTIPHNVQEETGWSFARFHEEALDVEHGVIRWAHNRPRAGRLLYIGGRTPLTLPSADTDVVEITRTEEILLAKVAALALLDQNMTTPTLATRERKARLARDIETLSEGHAEHEPVTLGRGW